MNWASTSMILALAFCGDKGFHDFVLRWPFQCVCSLGSIQQKPMNNWCPMWLVWGTHGWSIFIVKQSIFFLCIMYGAYCAQMFSCVWLFATAWTIACQVPLSMGFSRQEYWSGFPWLLQGIFLTQGSNLHLLDLLQWGRFPTSVPPGKSCIKEYHRTNPQKGIYEIIYICV